MKLRKIDDNTVEVTTITTETEASLGLEKQMLESQKIKIQEGLDEVNEKLDILK